LKFCKQGLQKKLEIKKAEGSLITKAELITSFDFRARRENQFQLLTKNKSYLFKKRLTSSLILKKINF